MQEEAKVAKADGQVGHASAEIEKERIISQLIEITAIPQAERYFQSQGDLLCKFCRKPGHLFRNCSEKEIQCLRCKKDHDPMRCPLGNVCFWCFNLGHNKVDCKKLQEPKYCQLCKMSSHSTQDCQKVWRDYLLEREPPVTLVTRKSNYSRPIPTTSDNKPFDSKLYKYHSAEPNVKLQVSCYYCGESGHFGDFCNRRRYGFATAYDVDNKEILILDEKIIQYHRKKREAAGMSSGGGAKGQGRNFKKGQQQGQQQKNRRSSGGSGVRHHSPFTAKQKALKASGKIVKKGDKK